MGSADKDTGSCKLQCGVLAVLLIVALQTVAVLMIAGIIPGKHDNSHRHTEKFTVSVSHNGPTPTELPNNATYGKVSTPIPVMATDPGMRYNSTSLGSQIRLDVMLETNCPDSVAAWPELKLAADYYGPGVLDLVVYQFQLPYHRWGHLSTQGIHTIQYHLGSEAGIAFMEHLFSVYDANSSQNTANKTYSNMLEQLASDAQAATGIDRDVFKAALGNYSHVTVWNWKLACTRGAAGTPWYYLNGVDLGINYVLKYQQLRQMIDPLLT